MDEAAARAAGVEIRTLTTLEEADNALAVAKATWGDHQLPPRELLRAFEGSGNLLQGAFRGKEMVGFALGFFGRDTDGFHLHSHMLAVVPDARTAGVGYSLKMAQRTATLDAGVSRIRWTFDPLIARNAHFNLSKLGAVADSFGRDLYGEMEDVLNAGDRSDRLWVRWDLNAGTGSPLGDDATVVLDRSSDDHPMEGVAPGAGSRSLVRIPREYAAFRERDPALAREWREASAVALQACFGAGLRAVSFDRDDSAYVFA